MKSKTHPLVAVRPRLASCCFGVVVAISAASCRAESVPMKFDLGDGPAAPGYTRVTPDDTYDPHRGYGFEPGAALTAASGEGGALVGDACVSDQPFLFSVALPEGNYHVTLTLGDPQAASDNTVRTENRRLMLEKVQCSGGEMVRKTIAVNVRTPALPDGRSVSLNDREIGSRNWDDKLTIEFNGSHPAVAAIEIEPANDITTIFLAGDSTVTDQRNEPWCGWGQVLPRFFKPSVVVSNHAESGRSLRSFAAQRRYEKILSMMKPGDYVFIQFGHNDMKEKGEGVGPFESYADSLRDYIAKAREKGSNPVLITPMHRRWFTKEGRVQDTFGDYPKAIRQVAQEQQVPLIDLHAMSEVFYNAMGPSRSKAAFVHYPANTFPDQPEPLKDNTHHNAYGAYQLALCVINGMKQADLDVTKELAEDVPTFDPSHPVPPDQFHLPPSPSPVEVLIPEGN